MKHVPLAKLADKIVRPGFEEYLRPLLFYRGNLSIGRVHRLWNFMISGMEHEATFSDMTQRLAMNPDYSQLCGPEKAPAHLTLMSFAGRLLGNPKVTDEMPGLREYVRELMPPYKRPIMLERVQEVTHRRRNMGAGGWRIFESLREPPKPMPDGFAEEAGGKTIAWAMGRYDCSRYHAMRWFVEAGFTPVSGKIKALPESFSRWAGRETNARLSERFGVSYPVIKRWRDETGVVRQYFAPKPAQQPTGAICYPFLIHDAGREEHALMRRVNAAVPKYLDPELRADICQDLIVGILCGDFSEDDLTLPAKEMTKRVQKMFPTKYGPLSLDAEIPGTEGFRLIDTLADDHNVWERI